MAKQIVSFIYVSCFVNNALRSLWFFIISESVIWLGYWRYHSINLIYGFKVPCCDEFLFFIFWIINMNWTCKLMVATVCAPSNCCCTDYIYVCVYIFMFAQVNTHTPNSSSFPSESPVASVKGRFLTTWATSGLATD